MKTSLKVIGAFGVGMLTHKRIMEWAFESVTNERRRPYRKPEPEPLTKTEKAVKKVILFFV